MNVIALFISSPQTVHRYELLDICANEATVSAVIEETLAKARTRIGRIHDMRVVGEPQDIRNGYSREEYISLKIDEYTFRTKIILLKGENND